MRTANAERRDADGTFVSDVDDGAFALLDYGNGAVARLTVDGTTAVDGYTCAVHGEDRTAVASGPTITDLTLYTIDGAETNELQCKPSPYANFASINANVPLLMELYDEFVKAIEGQPTHCQPSPKRSPRKKFWPRSAIARRSNLDRLPR